MHMQALMTEKQDWYMLDGKYGIVPVPKEHVGEWDPIRKSGQDFFDGYYFGRALFEIWETTGYGVRLSTDGFMDWTEWEVFTSKREASKRRAELARGEP